jgi:hypothetical protein
MRLQVVLLIAFIALLKKNTAQLYEDFLINDNFEDNINVNQVLEPVSINKSN